MLDIEQERQIQAMLRILKGYQLGIGPVPRPYPHSSALMLVVSVIVALTVPWAAVAIAIFTVFDRVVYWPWKDRRLYRRFREQADRLYYELLSLCEFEAPTYRQFRLKQDSILTELEPFATHQADTWLLASQMVDLDWKNRDSGKV